MTKEQRILALQIFLFVITLITTTLSGIEWIYGKVFFMNAQGLGWPDWIAPDMVIEGLKFSTAFIGILTVHELGHYFTAKYYKVDVTLPYYIPMWFGFGSTIGTLGAFIRIKQAINSRKEYFDIGLAGPLAGFILALIVLFYGFTHLPPAEYVLTIHPEYQKYGLEYAQYVYQGMEGQFYIGKNLLFLFFENYVGDPKLVPNQYEMMHYPFLFAGYLACFFTALNLLPIGQLDGGHILYGLIGNPAHKIVSLALFIGFIFYAGLGIVTPTKVQDLLDTNVLLYVLFLYFAFAKVGGSFQNALLIAMGILVGQFTVSYFFPNIHGYNGWMLFGLVLGRFLGIYHPTATSDEPLSLGRKVLGWVMLLVFILCFSPEPFVF
ncbi:MAG: site-2 protease family protein [Cytophagales bacterium]